MVSGLSIDSGLTLKTCGLREDVDTIALGLDRRKIAKSSLSSKYFFLMCLCLSVKSDAELRIIPFFVLVNLNRQAHLLSVHGKER